MFLYSVAGHKKTFSRLAVDMPGMLYDHLEKDSLAAGESLKLQMPDQGQPGAITAMIKPPMAVFSKAGFRFNADGRMKLNSGMEGPQTGTYTVDEEKSEITKVHCSYTEKESARKKQFM